MSAIHRPDSLSLAPLAAGERLDRPTFHARYEAMPPQTRAELINGVVHMPSPLGRDHGEIDIPIAGWLLHYQRFTKGVRAAANASTLLDDRAEPQPDALLRIVPERGGQSRDEGAYIAGAPELVIEIARSSLAIDLGPKRDDYERAGVREYLVVALEPSAIHWFARRGNRFEPLSAGADGWYRSEVLPGLWLDPSALFRHDIDALFAALEQGLASPEHAAFALELAARTGP